MKLAAILSLIVAIFYIIFLGMHPAYYMHLYPDVFAFYDRASFFWNHQTLKGLGYNEYQPGAILFFISLTPVFFLEKSVEAYKWGLFAYNSIFLLFLGWLFLKMEKPDGILLMSLVLIFLGPILLFRFDLLVILLTVLSFYLWEKNQRVFAMVILAFSVITKVYPIIFLPYLLFQSFKQGKKIESVYLLMVFCAAFFALLLSYTYFFQINLSETLTSYNFHGLKSVATESVWASAIYFFTFISGQNLPGMESAYGINAISRDKVYPSIEFYNYFWILPLAVFYLLYFFKNESAYNQKVEASSLDIHRDKIWEKVDYQFLAFITLIFLIFSKVLCNQYLSWFLLMLPLVELKTLLKKSWIVSIFLLIISLILHTFIYPLNYSSWLSLLSGGDFNLFLFFTMLASNFLLIAVAVIICFNIYRNHD